MPCGPACFCLLLRELFACRRHYPCERTERRATERLNSRASNDDRRRVDVGVPAGQARSVREIFQRHRQALYGFFCRRLLDAARAEELAQETFLAVIRGGTRYEPRALVR